MQDQYDGSTPNANDTAVLETYQYLGLNTIVQENRPQPGIDLTYIQQPNDTLYSSDGGDRYTGLDRFGRVADQYWTNVNAPASPTDRFQYGYDQNGNVLYKNNLVNSTFSELYHANSTSSGDNRTAYDSLNRLQGFRRGTLSASGNNGSGGLDTVSTLNTISDSSNSWNYDALGNQTSTQGGSQTRTFNAQNQIASISGLTTPTYDNNGNMTKDQAGNTYTYNAWNQLVSSSVKSEVLTYTATGLLLTDSTTVSGTTTKRYFFDSPQGQVLEDATQVSGTTSFDTYVWGLGYVDDLVARDAGNLGAVTRTYVQQDVNHNVTALIGSSGGVLERFTYDPYGSVTVLTSAWATTTDSQNWVYYFQGGRYNANIGFYYFRSRWYNPTTATWMSQDPTGTQYVDGANLYQFVQSDPTTAVDPAGLSLQYAGLNQGQHPRGTIDLTAFLAYLESYPTMYDGKNFILNDQWGGTSVDTGFHAAWDEQKAAAGQKVTNTNWCIIVERVYESMGTISSSVNELNNDLPRSDWRYAIAQKIVARFDEMAKQHEMMHVKNYQSHYNTPINAKGIGFTEADAVMSAVSDFEEQRRARDRAFDAEKHSIDINGDRALGVFMLYALKLLMWI